MMLEEFTASRLTLAAVAGGRLAFSSRDGALTSLVDLISAGIARDTEITLFDRYVGRAAALLMTLIDPRRVYAGIISEGGAEVLSEHKVPYPG